MTTKEGSICWNFLFTSLTIFWQMFQSSWWCIFLSQTDPRIRVLLRKTDWEKDFKNFRFFLSKFKVKRYKHSSWKCWQCLSKHLTETKRSSDLERIVKKMDLVSVHPLTATPTEAWEQVKLHLHSCQKKFCIAMQIATVLSFSMLLSVLHSAIMLRLVATASSYSQQLQPAATASSYSQQIQPAATASSYS